MDLMQPFLGQGQKVYIYTDNFYTSVPLFFETARMLLVQLLPIGKIPDGLKQEKNKLPIGSYKLSITDQLTACIWKDKRDVIMLSTTHNTSVSIVLNQPKGQKQKMLLSCQSCIAD